MIDAEHARALGRLRADRRRYERWIDAIAGRLRLSRAGAEEWLRAQAERGDWELVEVVALGAELKGGRITYPD